MKENIYAEEKTNHKMETIAENEHMHTHTGGKAKKIIFLTIDSVPSLQSILKTWYI